MADKQENRVEAVDLSSFTSEELTALSRRCLSTRKALWEAKRADKEAQSEAKKADRIAKLEKQLAELQG